MTTPNLFLQEVPAGSLQPGVPVNDSLQTLDALVQCAVEATTATPPTTDADDIGKRWIVGTGATGVWAGHEDQIALCIAATLWRYYAPEEGWQAYDKDQAAPLVYEGGSSGWALLSVPTSASAEDVSYDNATSGLAADNVQDAIDELQDEIDGISGGNDPSRSYGLSCSDLTTDLTTGTTKGYFRAPHAMTNMTFRASLVDASSSGVVTVDINKNGSTILSTKLTIDATEKTSLTATVPYVATSDTCSNDDEYTVDIDGAGTDAKGLIVWFTGDKP